MNPRFRALVQLTILLLTAIFLLRVFPAALAFVELAGREIRYLWWLVLLVALGIWLVWGINQKPRR
ncbi:MAG TPA: hypothetical protein VHH73_20515 [Verrucomicrobiae bacterium]|nr:hypothetical protein [Verrucomicrobiae bacterium]